MATTMMLTTVIPYDNAVVDDDADDNAVADDDADDDDADADFEIGGIF